MFLVLMRPNLTFMSTSSGSCLFRRKAQPFKLVVFTGLFLLISAALQAQDYQKSNKRFNRNYYRKQTTLYAHACNLLERKRNKKPKRGTIAKSYRANLKSSVLSIDPNTVTAKVGDTQPQAKPLTKSFPKPKVEVISEQKLIELHKKEDIVLERNNLPKPTSEKHEEIRKQISDKIASKKDIFPLTLAPLYFNFDQDEFSIVDMEPFLIAAEYALQGRTVLIEGHTDNHGQDNYNVKLSIKRVQKIRQLMLDMGVPDDRISVVGYGEELNKSKDNSEQGRQENRRVDFTVF
jgi:outer membrane protein OmpA-like peptidoglycan-associated protein